MQTGAHPLRATTVQQQRVGGDQQDLEEHEQVEQVAGEEGAVDPHQLELEQCMEVATAFVVPAHRIEQGEKRQHGSNDQQQCAQAIEQQNDAERRLPVARGINLQHALIGVPHQPEAQRQQ
ncbi:hypothetical protein D9M68_652380 [compost metagenome]